MNDPLVGKKIGQYELMSLIGQGGMAMVYRAHQTALKRDVAMKVVSSMFTQDPVFLERFNREVEMIAGLEHSHIVPVHEHGTTEDGITFLTMRYLRGGTLADRIRKGGFDLPTTNSILEQIAEALDYAHQHGVIHRDMKPSNILFDEQNNVYLSDFGLARMVDASRRKDLTEASTFLGTPAYVSPEQILKRPLDGRSDLYSLGVIVFEMLAGRPPFTGDSVFSIMRAHVDEPPPPIRQFRPDLPPAVEAALLVALSKSPDARFPTGTAFADAFKRATEGLLPTQEIQRPSKPISEQIRRLAAQRVSVGAVTLLGLLLLVIAMAGLFTLRINPTPTPSSSATAAAVVVPTLNPAARAAKGTPDDLKVSDSELVAAQSVTGESFIGMIACALSTDYHATLARAVRVRAESYKLPVKVEDAGADETKQPVIINRMVAQGAKAIVLCELNADAVAPALDNAQKAGVKVVRLSEIVKGENSLSLTFTNEAMGRAVGVFTADMINREMGGQATVAVLDFPTVPSVIVRANAMESALKSIAPRATIVGHFEGGLTENGEKSIADALKKFPDINVIMSINDAGALGAVKALKAAGKKPDTVKIVSVDAESEARRLITAGEYFVASVDSGAEESGLLAVDAIVKMLAGTPIPRQVFLPGRMVARGGVVIVVPQARIEAVTPVAPTQTKP